MRWRSTSTTTRGFKFRTDRNTRAEPCISSRVRISRKAKNKESRALNSQQVGCWVGMETSAASGGGAEPPGILSAPPCFQYPMPVGCWYLLYHLVRQDSQHGPRAPLLSARNCSPRCQGTMRLKQMKRQQRWWGLSSASEAGAAPLIARYLTLADLNLAWWPRRVSGGPSWSLRFRVSVGTKTVGKRGPRCAQTFGGSRVRRSVAN